jgi:hypothetical protein
MAPELMMKSHHLSMRRLFFLQTKPFYRMEITETIAKTNCKIEAISRKITFENVCTNGLNRQFLFLTIALL